MSNVIRLSVNLDPPDFSKVNPPIKVDDYKIDCRHFESRQALKEEIEHCFSQTGVVLLTNTEFNSVEELAQWESMLLTDPMAYQTPRWQVGKNSSGSINDVSAIEPPDIYIYPHNEMAYAPRFPQRLVFGCEAVPAQGGETLLFDNQATTHEILQTDIGQKLKEKGVRYVKNLTDASKTNDMVYKHWQDAFNVETKQALEQVVQENGWDLLWQENDRAQISYQEDAYEYNEKLQESLFFVNLGLLSSYFDNWHPFNTLHHQYRPFNLVHADGKLFTEQEIEYLVKVFNNYCLPIFWQPGWIVMLDNERWSHARPSYTLQPGEKRKLWAMMGMPKNRIGARF